MTYYPIENYGLIGNMRTAALAGKHGGIDWMCYPQFDSPSIFAAILDDEKGGTFQIMPVNGDDVTDKQYYFPDTNVLITRFMTASGVGEIVDFMPVDGKSRDRDHLNYLMRFVRCTRGSMTFQVNCTPAFNYARDSHDVYLSENGARFISESLSLGLSTPILLQQEGQGIFAEFSLQEGESTSFVLRGIEKDADCPGAFSEEEAENLFQNTIDYWHDWVSKCTYNGRWREIVYRSALVMKLMTYEPSGAIVASPTCSLPELVGGGRNWDYRYTWIRDAAFTLYGFMRIGFTEEAEQFIRWIEERCHELEPDGSLQIMYTIDGGHHITETTLDHLKGYRNSQPVRTGNEASNQLQLDIYGELMDAVYLYNKYGQKVSYDLWNQLRRLLDWVCENWQRKDDGIWEVRGGAQHFVYSKLMCWVALDRGLRLAEKRSFPVDYDYWRTTRDEIYMEIMEKGWDEKQGAFVQYYGSHSLDASNLIMPLVFFVSPRDPRMLSTLNAFNRSPDEGGLVSDSLVYRYDTSTQIDGLEGIEGTFNMCTFWLVEALSRAGKVDTARLKFERMISYANHLGLYAEETGVRGEALGNFPQAFTHLALISAAFNLDRILDEK